jgi:hypothetical protein
LVLPRLQRYEVEDLITINWSSIIFLGYKDLVRLFGIARAFFCIKIIWSRTIGALKTISPAFRYNPSGPNPGPLGFSLLSGLGRTFSFSKHEKKGIARKEELKKNTKSKIF